MNYAVNSASTVNYTPTSRVCSPATTPLLKLLAPRLCPTPVRRITINVGGERFQTYEETLARYPCSLLGSAASRAKFYDFARDEFVFPQCNKEVFNAILFFYQAKILSRPELVSLETFAKEVRFFGLARFSNEQLEEHVHDDVTETFPETNNYRNRLWNYLEYPRTQRARWFSKLNLFLIFMWIVIQCTETQVEPTVSETRNDTVHNEKEGLSDSSVCGGCLFVFDTIFVIWFTIDYLVHLAIAPRLLHYVRSPTGIIDLLTILPYYLELFTEGEATEKYQLLTFLRIFKFFKASRYSSSFRILVGSLTSSARDLPMWILLVTIHILFFSSIVFFVEREFGNPQFTNIPETMWFIVITMCAVGYGDVVPKSILGKFVTTLAAISGIVIVFCIPAPTLKKNFNRLNELYKSKKSKKRNEATVLHVEHNEITEC